jgi:hypothetical protein
MTSLKEEQDMLQKARVFRSEQNITDIFLLMKMSKNQMQMIIQPP